MENFLKISKTRTDSQNTNVLNQETLLNVCHSKIEQQSTNNDINQS